MTSQVTVTGRSRDGAERKTIVFGRGYWKRIIALLCRRSQAQPNPRTLDGRELTTPAGQLVYLLKRNFSPGGGQYFRPNPCLVSEMGRLLAQAMKEGDTAQISHNLLKRLIEFCISGYPITIQGESIPSSSESGLRLVDSRPARGT